MKETKLYTCEICNTSYRDVEKALECESNHKLLDKATIVGVYQSMNSFVGGQPIKIKVQFEGSDKWFEYRM